MCCSSWSACPWRRLWLDGCSRAASPRSSRASRWSRRARAQPPQGPGPRPKTAKNRVHFDLRPGSMDDEVAQLERLGAAVARR
ncbi:MAG: VOC family protein, partial [Streptosporangiaceae bacterium]